MTTPLTSTAYTAEVTADAGRDGSVRSPDGVLDLPLGRPPGMGGKEGDGRTNPEQLFAAGYAACFHSALLFIARQDKITVTGSTVTAKVSIGAVEAGGFGLAVTLEVDLPDVTDDDAKSLMAKAHMACPYSRATRGNIDVEVIRAGVTISRPPHLRLPDGVVVACCTATEPAPTPVGSVGRTGIAKQIRAEGISATPHAVLDDVVCNTRYHGGPDKALYAYGEEDATWWAAQLGRPVPPGLFGENLHLRGIDMQGALIGERWRIGDDVEVEVTMPRIPCVTFQHHMGEERWLKRFTAGGRPGTYLRVHAGGRITPGAAVAVVHRPQHGVSVSRWFTDASPADALALLQAADAEGLRLAPFLLPQLQRAAARS